MDLEKRGCNFGSVSEQEPLTDRLDVPMGERSLAHVFLQVPVPRSLTLRAYPIDAALWWPFERWMQSVILRTNILLATAKHVAVRVVAIREAD